MLLSDDCVREGRRGSRKDKAGVVGVVELVGWVESVAFDMTRGVYLESFCTRQVNLRFVDVVSCIDAS